MQFSGLGRGGLSKRIKKHAIKTARISTKVALGPGYHLIKKRPPPGAGVLFGAKKKSAARRAVAAQRVPVALAPVAASQMPGEETREEEEEEEERAPRAAPVARAARRAVAVQRVPAALAPAAEESAQEEMPEESAPEEMPEESAPDESAPDQEGQALQGLGKTKWKKVRKNLRKAAMAAVVVVGAVYGGPIIAAALKGSGAAAGKLAGSKATDVLKNPAMLKKAAALLKADMAKKGTPISDAEAEALVVSQANESKAALDVGKPPPDAVKPWTKYIPIILPVFALAIAAMKG